ncbi:hypothetical protein Scep_015757 [Stephania cephalantha]|uniref:Tify domain-containing protein n=1 Tax=Stephania cephalantha TaxID=152367 RepID=A0AAP0P468_9MAGN
MSFQGKAFWMPKESSCLNDGEMPYDNSSRIPFDNPSRIEQKRSHQWFLDATEAELFPNKKQAIETSNSRPIPGVSNANFSHWESAPSFQSVPNHFTDRLFGAEPARNINFVSRGIPTIGTGNLNLGRRGLEEHFGNDANIALSMSHTMDDPGSYLSYGGIRKVKINQVKDSDGGIPVSMGHHFSKGDNNTIFFNQVGHSDGGMSMSMGHSFNKGEVNTISFGQGKDPDHGIPLAVAHSFSKGEGTTISFSSFQEPETNPSGRLISNYDLLLSQPSVPQSEVLNEKELVEANKDIAVSTSQLAATVAEPAPKTKSEPKESKKLPPNNFPSNVRSLLSTGILDGVPVKYISWSREVLNAYEFERHAGCKTKHPNNHIFFDNGKTIYGIVQELRSTPQNMLFDAIQTVTGSPINEKSFRIWKGIQSCKTNHWLWLLPDMVGQLFIIISILNLIKLIFSLSESFQAATRELQRIYGKDEINQL